MSSSSSEMQKVMSEIESEGMLTESEEGGTKRKGSPLSKTEVKLLAHDIGDIGESASQPAERKSERRVLRRQTSLTDLPKMTSSKDKKGSGLAFSDMVKLTFNDASFTRSITPVLYDMMSPLILNTIETSVAATVEAAVKSVQAKVVDQIVESNRQLQESVKEQTRVVEEQRRVIEIQDQVIVDQKNAIEDQSKQLQEKTETIEQLEMQVDCLMLELDSVKNDLNDLEQYGRRNSIRLNNYISILPLKDEEQIIKSFVHYLNANVLRGDKPLQLKDIERCHYVGRAKKDKPRQIIVKFSHYHDKQRVYAAKSNLKGNPSKTFMTEDLTSSNHSVVKQLLALKKVGKIDSFWTSNGRILVKRDATSEPTRVSSQDSVLFKLQIEPEPEGATTASAGAATSGSVVPMD